jgi:hypothetical protein
MRKLLLLFLIMLILCLASSCNGNNGGAEGGTTQTLDHFVISNILNQTAGQSFPITITAIDNNGYTYNSFSGNVSLADSTGTISPAAAQNFSNGKLTVNCTVSTQSAGNKITVTASGKSGSSNTFSVNAAVPATPPKPDGIPWDQAKYHFGENLTVYGPVASTKYATGSKGKPTFLDIGNAYPSTNRFDVVIWVEYRGNFPANPEVYYSGKTISVTGTIINYNGIPQIQPTSVSQIRIL